MITVRSVMLRHLYMVLRVHMLSLWKVQMKKKTKRMKQAVPYADDDDDDEDATGEWKSLAAENLALLSGFGRGGCGACVVLLSRYDPKKEEVEDYSISSCLTLLCSINGCSITTTEGLGNSRDGLHPIHQRFAGFHATQCGFCTPGMCMSLFSALVNADKAAKSSPPPPAADGFSNITCSEAEKAIAGNLCRCTGYRPIADVCKSFAADVDIEDLGFNSFWTKGANADAKKFPLYGRDGGICTFPDFLKDEIKSSMDVISDSPMATKSSDGIEDAKLEIPGKWYSPKSIDELQNLLEFEVEKNGNRVKLVTGNTGAGIYKMDYYDKYIDLSHIPELSVIRRQSTGIEIGAAVSISKAIGALREEIKGGPPGLKETMVFTKIADHMNKVASQFVRNTASVGGNIIMAQRNSFPSDIATILLAAGSSVNIHSGSEVKSLTLEAFLQMPPCNSRTLLLSIRIPTWNSPRNSTSGSKLLFETYRASPRPLGNASAYINAAFLAFVSTQNMSESFVLENLRLVFGAYGTKHAIRAKKVEEFLSGKSITPALLLGAIRLLRETIEPAEGTPNAAYRSSLAVGFLFDFLRPFVKGRAEPIDNIQMKNCHVANGTEAHNGGLNGYSNGLTNGLLENGCLHDRKYHPESANSLLSSKQTIEISKEYKPVGLPTKKVGAELQASGEALYVDDIPSPQDCLYGAFIYGTRPLARVKGIRFTSASASERIIKVISVKDIPQGGNNIGSMSMFAGEPLFADDITQCAGQPLGFVVAETQRHANMAANQVAVDYDIENLEPPILTVEEAVDRSSFFEVPSLFNPKPVGDFSKGMAEAEHKIVSAKIELGSQYYFYMETQTALAVPDEDNCMVVYASTQIPEMAQCVIARCLGIPDHNVRVITRRAGGAFGGKLGRSLPVAAACALAAYKLRRPVRSYLDRKTDMIMAGGRHPMKINYTVGFKSDGKITALHINLLLNAGISEDVSPIIPYCIVDSLKTYNWGALSFDMKVCKLNHSSKSAMRGPGQLQASYIAETVIEHVASFLSMEPDPVRKKNLHSFESLKLFYGHLSGESTEYTLPSILDRLATSASFHQRTEMVKQFNVRNKWRKRGISRVPCVYGVLTNPIPGKVSVLNDGSIVVEVGGIELGQGLWTKVKQVTAFALAQLWTNGSQDLLERVRVVQADTLSLVQGGWTISSTTSEASCEASRIACNILVERLMPLKKRLEEQMGAISWDTLILQANLQAVNLSAHTLWNPDASTKEYINFGATVSEVEIDLLTGATTILRTDIIYDCGKSLNPAVDLGQIEGSFVQGIGFYMLEEYLTNSSGLVISEGPRTYTVPTIDTIPKEFNVELLNSGHHEKRVLSSKACGEPPLLMAVSIHCAVRQAIKEARKELLSNGIDQPLPMFEMKVPATMPVVKELCGLDNVEKYLETLISHQ